MGRGYCNFKYSDSNLGVKVSLMVVLGKCREWSMQMLAGLGREQMRGIEVRAYE